MNLGRGTEVGMIGWRHSNVWIFLTMLLSAVVSLYSSFVLSVDAILLAEDPSRTFNCDLNTAISCSTVGASWQAELLGFPNAFIGLMTEPVVITIAVAGLAGVVFPRWFMFAAQVVYFFGLIFAYWLFYQSAFVIGALCPYCLLITVGTTFVFFTLLHYNIREDNLYLPKKIQEKVEFASRVGLDAALPVLLITAVAFIILVKYGAIIFA